MKAVILYKPNSEMESSVQDYIREFAHQTGKTIALVDSDSVQGIEIAKLYDIVQFPSIVVFRDDGSFIESWLDREKWPTVSELSFYNQ
jgi:hypothetical protein